MMYLSLCFLQMLLSDLPFLLHHLLDALVYLALFFQLILIELGALNDMMMEKIMTDTTQNTEPGPASICKYLKKVNSLSLTERFQGWAQIINLPSKLQG